MSKEIYISSTPHETRLAIVENDELAEIYYERENEYTLAGSIYNGRVTRVLPGMQSSFVDIGLERDAFLYITDFMEEAGDSADFETTHGGSGEARGPRSDGQRSDSQRGDRGSRNDRGDRQTPVTIEASATAPAEGEGRSDQPRAEQNGRDQSGRDKGGRGRNRRGRGNRDRSQGNSDRPAVAGERDPITDRALDEDLPRAADEAAQTLTPVPPPEDVETVGEGAPGADGSRRWRGRRGRRRGRGGLAPAGDAARESNGAATPAAAEEENFLEYAPEIDAAVETAPEFEAAPAQEAYPGEEEPARSAPREGGRNDRGDRGDRDRSGRGRNDRGPRAPRGFAPSHNLYGVDSAGTEESAAPSEPIILPGESLSKYRRGDEAASAASNVSTSSTSAPANVIVPKPTTVIDDSFVATAWDGGAVLPGETLSRRSRPESGRDGGRDGGREARRDQRRDGRAEHRQENRQDNRQNLRNDEPVVPQFRSEAVIVPAPQVVHDAEGLSVISPAEEQPEVAQVAHHEAVPESEILHEVASPFAAAVPAALDPIAAIPEPGSPEPIEAVSPEPIEAESSEPIQTAHTEAEYEPSEASASYRIDPVAPSEFRQSAPVIEPEVVEPEPVEPEFEEELIEEEAFEEQKLHEQVFHQEPETMQSTVLPPLAAEELPIHVDHSHPFNRLDEADAEIEPSAVELHAASEAPAPAAYHEPAPHLDTTGVPPPPPPFFGHADTAAAQPDEVTYITPTGEMHSEPVAATPLAEAITDPTSPILHESSIVATPQSGTMQSFAPGTGTLEEELLDDEEHETATLHAHFDEEFDDLEEETLEGAADLGTMIREMSIDQITRTGDAEADEDEDDDFDEEEAEGSADSDLEDAEEEEYAEGDKPATQSAADAEFFANTFREPGTETEGAAPREYERRPRREGGRDGRRDGRSGGRDGRDRNRSRNTGGEGDRSRFSNGGGRSRQSVQATNLPAISDLLKPGQEILVQIAKEPIAKKGARITSHIALPGRFLVFMPTVNHTGVSRKIESDSERRRLKEILLSEKGDAAGGFIVRTAASGASEDELRSDLRFLLNLWADIKQRSESSKSPALIYHDLNLVERILRDQVTDNFSAIWVDTETEYERVLRFLQRFQPSLIRRVKLYSKETPLFEQFGITEEINKALRSKVWLKSGGSIVINQTEALVAIDINTGKFVGKTARLEDTIVKTNLDAIPEIVRQIRLRDLGGIIIIDFIDMDERKNRNKVMAALEEELKSDRAPSKVLQFNDFGLVAITRKRVKQSLERTLSTTCGVCQGTGMTKSPITVCNDIYIEMRKMHKHLDRGDVMLRVHPEVVKQLKSGTSKWLQEMEEMVGKTILVKSDPSLHPEQFDIH